MEQGKGIMIRLPNGSDIMKMPDEVSQILALKRLGLGSRGIAKKLGISRNTVKKYLSAGGYLEYKPPNRTGILDAHLPWLIEQMKKHGNNAEVVRQELEREKSISVSLRTVERAVMEHRTLIRAELEATTRFETGPGEQSQIDFGERLVPIDGERVKVYFFVFTLSYSRRPYVRAFTNERQESWFVGMESAFRHFGGVTETILLDNPKPLVKSHDMRTREVAFTESFKAFAKHWGFAPRACAPYRPRTKGKDERGVGYVKKNAIAGREFESWAALEAHLEWWMREIADVRIHGTTEERPIDRFESERFALIEIEGKPSYVQVREVVRVVHSDLCVELDTNSYSVPWNHIGQDVTVRVRNGIVTVHRGDVEIARHGEAVGRKQRIIDRSHYFGLALPGVPTSTEGELARSLDEYAKAMGES